MELMDLKERAERFCEEGNHEEAYRYYLEAALVYNDPDALHMLALMYYIPALKKGVDYKKAFQFFLMACKAGKEPFEVLDSILDDHKCVDKNTDARDGYRKVLDYLMDIEWPPAFIYVGDEYLSSHFVFLPNVEKGLASYEKAAELGEEFGYECLGTAYYTGTAGKVDYQKAFEYFTKKEEYYSDQKYYYLGEMYYHGHYVEQNYIKAKENYEGLLSMASDFEQESKYIPLAKKRLKEMECY